MKKPNRITVSFSDREYTILEALAREQDSSLSWVVRRAVTEFIRNQEAPEQTELPLDRHKAGQIELLDASELRSSGEAFDLRPLQPALNLPDDSELSQRLASVYGIPAAIGLPELFPCDAVADAVDVLTRIHCPWVDDPPLEAIQSAIDVGTQRPGLPTALPAR